MMGHSMTCEVHRGRPIDDSQGGRWNELWVVFRVRKDPV